MVLNNRNLGDLGGSWRILASWRLRLTFPSAVGLLTIVRFAHQLTTDNSVMVYLKCKDC